MSANIRSVYRTSGYYALIALFMALIAVSTASARSDPIQRIPHPISPAELDEYAELLDLSIEQQHAVEIKHDVYLDDLAPLRQQMIDVISDMNIRFRTFDDEGILVERLPRWINQIRLFDDRFFADIARVLTESQQERMHRLRLRRERDIYYELSAFVDTLGDNIPDLSVFVDRLELTREEQAKIDPILLPYEERLTRELRHVLDALLRDCRNPQNVHRRGVPLDEDGNPIIEKPEAVDTTQALIDRVRSLREFNHRTYHELVAVLPERARDEMYHLFYSRAYGTAYDSSQFHILPVLTDALALPDLAKSDRAAFKRIRDDLTRERRAMIEQSIDQVDEAIIRVASPGSPSRNSPMNKATSDLLKAVQPRDNEAFLELKKRLSESQLETINVRRPPPPMRATGRWRTICNVHVYTQYWQELTPVRYESWQMPDVLTPMPIDEATFHAILQILHVDGEHRRQFAESFRAYRATTEETLRPFAMSAALARSRRDAAGNRINTEQQQELIQTAREAYRLALSKADKTFFDAMREVLGIEEDDDQFKLVSNLRARQNVAVRATWSREPKANLAGRIDLVTLAARDGILAAVQHRDAIDRLMQEYGKAMVSALEKQRTAYIRFQELFALRTENRGQEFRAIADDLRAAQQRIRDAHKEVVELNESFVQHFARALPNADGNKFLDAFEQAAYPKAFDDPNEMDRVIMASLALDDLSESQRTRLRDVRTSHSDRYERHRERMIELCRSFSPDLPRRRDILIAERQKAIAAWQLRMELLREKRDRINRVARRHVRSILSPAQLERVALPSMQ